MEEQILKIIMKYHIDLFMQAMGRGYETDKEAFIPLVKEITSHVMEFIEWIIADVVIDSMEPQKYEIYSPSDRIDIVYTTEELYKYWLTNIKNK
jgi:hypothetical protein